MRCTLLSLCCLLMSASSLVAAEPADTFTIRKALPFSEAVPKLTLDLYLPTDSAKPMPCVIVIQGGGFAPQNGQRFRSFAEHLANNGFAAALISYRGRPMHRYRDTLSDVRASVAYVRSVGRKHNIDTTRIGAMGRSAGGTLAALLAVTGDKTDAKHRIQAAVCFAGVFDFASRFTDKDQLALQPRHKGKLASNGEWIGSPFAATDKDWLAASAITHVDKDDPPILFLHAKDDTTVPWLQSRDMHRAMTNVSVRSELQVYPNGGHAVRPRGENPLDAMVAFFRQHLK